MKYVMDDFAVDLDKVLDDFELSEGDHNIQDCQSSHIKNDVRLDPPRQTPLSAGTTEKENNVSVPSLYDIPYDTHEAFDVVDGNFAPQGLCSELQSGMNPADGGYFVPEGASDGTDDVDGHVPGTLNGPAMFCFEGESVGHVGSGLSAFSVYDKHRTVDAGFRDADFVPEDPDAPELLHNAFDGDVLPDLDSDTEPSMRPSFMSSSPPTSMTLAGISQPDVVPAMMDAQLNVSLPCCELADDTSQAVAICCSRDDENTTAEVAMHPRTNAEDCSSQMMSCADSGESDKEVTATNDKGMVCDGGRKLGDVVDDESLNVSNSADIIMDIQSAPETLSGSSSASLPDVSSHVHPGKAVEPMNVSLADETSAVGFGTIKADSVGEDETGDCLAEMPQDGTCRKDLIDTEQPMAVGENEDMRGALAVSPCVCHVTQSEQNTSGRTSADVLPDDETPGRGVVGVQQGDEPDTSGGVYAGHQLGDEQDSSFRADSTAQTGVDVGVDSVFSDSSFNSSFTTEPSENTDKASSMLEAEIGTTSVSEYLGFPSGLVDGSGGCDSSVMDTGVGLSVTEKPSDVLTSYGDVVLSQYDGSEALEPSVGLERNGDGMAVDEDSNRVTDDRTAQCDTTHNSTHSETVLENVVDKPFDANEPPLVISKPMTGGARPKEHMARRNRPNSLLGLSKPDVGPAPGDVDGEMVNRLGGGVVVENCHDVINRQLAQQRARSPLQKQQLNMEIRQLGSGVEPPAATLDNKMLDNKFMNDPESLTDTAPQVCPADGLSSTLLQPNVVRAAKPPCSLGVSSAYSAVPPGGDAVTTEGGSPQQRRPCSLTLPPRNDFQPESRSLQDVDAEMVTESDAATGDHVESSAPAAATEAIPPAPGLVAPPSSINPLMAITELGKVAPVWLPDAEASNCMQCDIKFTFTRRRHHCRCCGKVFCSACCNLKISLSYLEEKEARVCSCCYQDLVRAQVYEKHHSAAAASPRPSPNPNNPSEYCSTVPPALQGPTPSLPPTVMVPGVLRKQGLQKKGEPKQVIFSDGIRPGGDLTELDGPSSQPPLPVHKVGSRKMKKTDRTKQNDKTSPKNAKLQNSNKNCCLIPADGLPPVILPTGVKGDYSLEENPSPETFMPQIRSAEDPSPVVFAINKNLFVMVKIVNLDCCVNRVCMSFSTKGMCTVAQDEIVIILQCLPDEKTVPRDIFVQLLNVYDNAAKGNTVTNMDHSIFTENILGSKDYGGFLYIRPSFQCLHRLILPQPPYVIGILLQKWEIPWAKVFPVRLMLRLGAEYRYYPCPLISVRDRKPVYGEIGHTIMNLLADFRNYQYQLMCVRGLVVHMEEKKTYINLPRNRYNEVMKVISNSNDYVMAFGANFSQQADSHLVCIQNEDGNYQTQAINIQSKPRKVTGASFVVFNGALKASSGLRAKSSIVEDGLMVQVMADTMAGLKQALHAMTDYTIGCGSLQAPEPEESVIVQWVEDDHNVNIGVKSAIDGKSMDGIQSVHIHNAMDCIGDNRTIRWTEVFFIENEDRGTSRCEPVDLSRLAETLARASCVALVPHLDLLKDAGLTRLALRATIDTERVGYEVGGNGRLLPPFYMNSLDSELIPVIHSAASSNQEGPIVLELIFHIIE